MEFLTRHQIRLIDNYAIEHLGLAGIVLMENAGRNVAEAVSKYMGGVGGRHIAIVAGGGNNGGDGFVAARHLAMHQARVSVFCIVPFEQFSGDAKTNLNVIRKLEMDVHPLAEPQIKTLAATLKNFELIIDAIGGTGIKGPLHGVIAEAVQQLNAAVRDIIAVDIPTGLDCDVGRAEGPAVRAKLTVTLVARKKGFEQSASTLYTGKVVVADIGIPADLVHKMSSTRKI